MDGWKWKGLKNGGKNTREWEKESERVNEKRDHYLDSIKREDEKRRVLKNSSWSPESTSFSFLSRNRFVPFQRENISTSSSSVFMDLNWKMWKRERKKKNERTRVREREERKRVRSRQTHPTCRNIEIYFEDGIRRKWTKNQLVQSTNGKNDGDEIVGWRDREERIEKIKREERIERK